MREFGDAAGPAQKFRRRRGLAGAVGAGDYEEVRHAGNIFSFLSAFYRCKNNGVAASIKNMFNEAVTWHC
jgi:hypothetical protein